MDENTINDKGLDQAIEEFESTEMYKTFDEQSEKLYAHLFERLPEDLQSILLEYSNLYENALAESYPYFYNKKPTNSLHVEHEVKGSRLEIIVNLRGA